MPTAAGPVGGSIQPNCNRQRNMAELERSPGDADCAHTERRGSLSRASESKMTERCQLQVAVEATHGGRRRAACTPPRRGSTKVQTSVVASESRWPGSCSVNITSTENVRSTDRQAQMRPGSSSVNITSTRERQGHRSTSTDASSQPSAASKAVKP